MMFGKQRSFILALTILTVPLHSMNVLAETQDHGAQQPHVHGWAALTIALEREVLELNLESPAVNLVGFEHKASTPEQIKAVETAKTVLESPGRLFRFTGTDCRLTQTTVNVSSIAPANNKTHADDVHEQGHHGHSAKKGNHDDASDPHGEITARYHYRCKQAAKLTAISVRLLAQFPAIDKLNVQWITDTQQGAAQLREKSATIHLR